MPPHDPNLSDPVAIERARKLPTPFQLFRFMTGSEHMHFGLFERPDETFAVAQDRMMQRVLAMYPEGAKRVLDVGCGCGGTSVELAERGMEVLAFAPDSGLIQSARSYAIERDVTDRVEFRDAGLHQIPVDGSLEPFDVVMCQESLQYIHPIDQAMAHLYALVRPDGGRLVIGDQVLRAPERAHMVQFHPAESILREAENLGLRLVEHHDVTEMARHQGPKSIEVLRQEYDRILEFYADSHPTVKADLDLCLLNGGEEAQWYVDGALGYELFCFER